MITSNNNIRDLFKEALKQTTSLNDSIRDAIRDYLSDCQDKAVNLCNNTAYCLVQGSECAFETPVFGVRLKDGVIEIALDSAEVEDEERGSTLVPLWGKDNTKADGDHYITFNWMSILESLSNTNLSSPR